MLKSSGSGSSAVNRRVRTRVISKDSVGKRDDELQLRPREHVKYADHMRKIVPGASAAAVAALSGDRQQGLSVASSTNSGR